MSVITPVRYAVYGKTGTKSRKVIFFHTKQLFSDFILTTTIKYVFMCHESIFCSVIQHENVDTKNIMRTVKKMFMYINLI